MTDIFNTLIKMAYIGKWKLRTFLTSKKDSNLPSVLGGSMLIFEKKIEIF